MTSEEMANDEVKKQREQFVQEGIKDSRLAQVEVRQQGSIPFLLFSHVSVHVRVPISDSLTGHKKESSNFLNFMLFFCPDIFRTNKDSSVSWFLETIPSCPVI
jgi:hypothetical protein